jgi:quercetin dioxygenase-like cupin family protein
MKIIPKGWGHEEIIHNADGYCGKILVFNKGKKCSFHYHKIKTETFYCQGKIIVRYSNGDDIEKANFKVLSTGDTFHVPVGLRHQMEALEDTKLFEFSTIDHESDSIRIIKGD